MSAPVVAKLYLLLLLNSFLPVICSLALAWFENGISSSTILPIQEDLKSHLPQDMPLLTPGANFCVGHYGGPYTSNPVLSYLCSTSQWLLPLQGRDRLLLLNPVHLQVLGNGHFCLFVFIWFGLFSIHPILLASFTVKGAVGLLTKVPSPLWCKWPGCGEQAPKDNHQRIVAQPWAGCSWSFL